MNTTKVKVEVRNGDINRALKIFKRRVIQSGHIQELKDRKEYTKPTTVRRKKKQRAIRAEKRRLEEENTEDQLHNPLFFVKNVTIFNVFF